MQIAPEDFSKESFVAIEDNINAKYANKVGNNIFEQAHETTHLTAVLAYR